MQSYFPNMVIHRELVVSVNGNCAGGRMRQMSWTEPGETPRI